MESNKQNEPQKPKLQGVAEGLAGLTLGISIVVAILLGVGFGVLLKNLFGLAWLFWIGVFCGVGAAILNVYKSYKAQVREFDTIKDDPKYSYKGD